MQQRSFQQVRVSMSLIFLIHGLIIATWASKISAFQAHLHLSSAVLGRSSDFCSLERVERFRINPNGKNFASQKNTLTSSRPKRCRAVGTFGSRNDTLVNASHVRSAAKKALNSGGTGRSRRELV
jgi:hypothetical protein